MKGLVLPSIIITMIIVCIIYGLNGVSDKLKLSNWKQSYEVAISVNNIKSACSYSYDGERYAISYGDKYFAKYFHDANETCPK